MRAPAAVGSAHGQAAQESEINILSILRLLRRRILAIMLITIAGTVLCAAGAMMMTPLYSATAVLRVDPSTRSPVADSSDPVLNSSQAINAIVESDVEMLESPALMRKVVEELGLDKDPEFVDAESPVDMVKDFVRALLMPPSGEKAKNPAAAATGALAGNVEASRIGLTYLVEFEAWSRNPEKASRIANTAVEQSLKSQITAKRENVARVNTLLNDHIAELRERLQASEEAVQRYMNREGLNKQHGGTPNNSQASSGSADFLNAEILANLRQQHAGASQKFAEVSTRYGPNHPETVRARTELEKVSDQIARLSEKTVRLNELQREADANRDLYQAVLQRAKQSAAAQELQMPSAYIVTRAGVPTVPTAPKRTVIVVIGFVVSLGLAMAYALAREVMASGIRDAEDLRQTFGLSPIASVPRVGTARRRAIESFSGELRSVYQPARLWSEVLDHPESAFSESIRSLRFSLNHYAELGAEMRVLMISSVQQGEGKTTVAANLAREAAAAGERVLLIDADLRRPTLASAFGISDDGGLVSLLSGSDDQRYRIQREPRSGVHVIAGNRGVPGALALRLLSSQAMAKLLRIARRNFDLVVIDTAPLRPITDPRALIDRVDGVVMVVSEQTTHEMIAAALHETPGLNERLVGIVLNRILDGAGPSYSYTWNDNPNAQSS